VDLKELGYRDEPFVLAKDITQVFYMKDMSSKSKKDNSSKSTKDKSEDDEPKCHIVLAGKEKLWESMMSWMKKNTIRLRT
jgi:hypothetical protein